MTMMTMMTTLFLAAGRKINSDSLSLFSHSLKQHKERRIREKKVVVVVVVVAVIIITSNN